MCVCTVCITYTAHCKRLKLSYDNQRDRKQTIIAKINQIIIYSRCAGVYTDDVDERKSLFRRGNVS